jgi:sporulation protein YlmC with PRC-barrel domain
MLRSFKALRGFAIRATDGRVGTVRDLYFDDRNWRVRHCVVDSEGWFASRAVLIGPRSLSVLDSARRELWVRLAKAEVTRSPKADSNKPVSKQHASRVMTSIRRLAPWSSDRSNPRVLPPDDHLRSCSAVIGHRVHGIDGAIGYVDDFLIDDKGWVVRELIVGTGHQDLSSGGCVLVAAQRVGRISGPNASVSIGLPRDSVLKAPLYTPMSTEATMAAFPVKLSGDRRLVGPWCFLDRFGPLTFSEGKPIGGGAEGPCAGRDRRPDRRDLPGCGGSRRRPDPGGCHRAWRHRAVDHGIDGCPRDSNFRTTGARDTATAGHFGRFRL